jgi:glutamate dehydrogenase
MAALDGQSIEFTPMLTDSPLARIHYLVRARTNAPAAREPAGALEARIARLAQRWEDECTSRAAACPRRGPGSGTGIRFADAFPTSYREDFSAPVAAEDADMLAGLSATSHPWRSSCTGRWTPVPACCASRFTTRPRWRCRTRCPCWSAWVRACWTSTPIRIGDNGDALWIHDLGLQLPVTPTWPPSRSALRPVCPAWRGEVESDDLNKLVLVTTLDARAIAVLARLHPLLQATGFCLQPELHRGH